MNNDLAEHISLLAAPIYAAMLAPWFAAGKSAIDTETLNVLRRHALDQAMALWLDAREYER